MNKGGAWESPVAALVYWADVSIATLHHDGRLASCSKSRRARLQSIAEETVKMCEHFKADPGEVAELRNRLSWSPQP